MAFYADCRHEVKPVKSGYRVTLTFNLLAHTDRTGQAADQPVTELARCLTEHFTTRVRGRFATGELDPHRLVYLLDHEYTQRGLSWNRLKGADAERAALLRAAADQADCEAVLALAEVKETWECYPYEDQRDDYRYCDEDEDEDDCGDDPDQDGYELTDLIDSDISLGWWTSPSGKGGEVISLHVPDSEVCTIPSVELTPYESEYEGNMGNYGNTMDRWYRRAALVVWPRERAFTARAEASIAAAGASVRCLRGRF